MELHPSNQDEPQGNNEKPIERIEQAVLSLRERIKASIDKHFELIEDIPQDFSGTAFVEEVGSNVEVKNGNTEFFYTGGGLKLRDPHIDRNAKNRTMLFQYIASELPPNLQVLNIGAGGDTTLIDGFERAGHEVISTDFSQELINELRKRTNSPTFACDLENLSQVVPENGVDIIVGNSVLGYIDPKKAEHVVENLVRTMDKGAVFTFDMPPHPGYLEMVDDINPRRVANPTTMDPMKLLENIKSHGRDQGIKATQAYYTGRIVGLKLAVIDILSDFFQKYGLRTSKSSQAAGKIDLAMIRVAKHDADIIRPLDEEETYTDSLNIWSKRIEDGKMLHDPVFDRYHAELLAKELGLRGSIRDYPTMVRELCLDVQQRDIPITAEMKKALLSDSSPSQLRQKLMPFYQGQEFVETPIFDSDLMQEQTKRRLFQAHSIPQEAIEIRIDELYESKANENPRIKQMLLSEARQRRNKSKRKRKKSR